MVTAKKKDVVVPTHEMRYWLRKIYLLERLKNRYLRSYNFASYKKACGLQEKIVLSIQSPQYRKKLVKENSEENRKLASSIREQVDINQVLLDDIQQISMGYLEPLVTGYYDREGNMRKTAKIFRADI